MQKVKNQIRTTELDELSDVLIQQYSTEDGLKTEAYLKPVFVEMTDVSARITDAIRKDKAYSDLEDADAERDEVATRIYRIVDGYAAMPMAAVSGPAQRLQKILQKFSGLTRKPYNEETSLIEAMQSDLSSADAMADIGALNGLSETLALLRQSQDAFMAKRVQYNTANSERKYDDTASALKKPLLALINDKLVPYLTLMQVQDAGKYGHFAAAVERAIGDANSKIKARSEKNDEVKEIKE